jgi:hypothetical protein
MDAMLEEVILAQLELKDQAQVGLAEAVPLVQDHKVMELIFLDQLSQVALMDPVVQVVDVMVLVDHLLVVQELFVLFGVLVEVFQVMRLKYF